MINDPYEVLGVSRNASQDEIKKAYLELVKKYHPDKYQGNPLADLAEEKLQEVNEAYNMIAGKNGSSGTYQYGSQQDGGQYYNSSSSGSYGSSSSGSYGSSSSGSYGSSYGGPNASIYREVRVLLDRGDLYRAEQLLINASGRDAEWYFLSGVLSFKKGFAADGLANLEQAMRMDPGNLEYQNIYMQMQQSGAVYRNSSNGGGYQRVGVDPTCAWLPLCLCCPGPGCC